MTALTPTAALSLRELDSEVSQRVFHAAMEALARPGTIHRMPPAAVPAPTPAVLAPLIALADIMTPIAAVDSAESAESADALIAAVARLVSTRAVAPASARFGLALAEPDDLSTLNRGSHWSPEEGAMLLQRVTSLEVVTDASPGEPAWRLTGPGIKPGEPALLRVGGLGERFVAQRAERVSDYPSGIDVLLVTDDGEIVGLPRTTRIEIVSAGEAAAAEEAAERNEVI